MVPALLDRRHRRRRHPHRPGQLPLRQSKLMPSAQLVDPVGHLRSADRQVLVEHVGRRAARCLRRRDIASRGAGPVDDGRAHACGASVGLTSGRAGPHLWVAGPTPTGISPETPGSARATDGTAPGCFGRDDGMAGLTGRPKPRQRARRLGSREGSSAVIFAPKLRSCPRRRTSREELRVLRGERSRCAYLGVWTIPGAPLRCEDRPTWTPNIVLFRAAPAAHTATRRIPDRRKARTFVAGSTAAGSRACTVIRDGTADRRDGRKWWRRRQEDAQPCLTGLSEAASQRPALTQRSLGS